MHGALLANVSILVTHLRHLMLLWIAPEMKTRKIIEGFSRPGPDVPICEKSLDEYQESN